MGCMAKQGGKTGQQGLEIWRKSEWEQRWLSQTQGRRAASPDGAEGHAPWDSISKEQVTSDNFTAWGGDAQFPLEFREEWVTDA